VIVRHAPQGHAKRYPAQGTRVEIGKTVEVEVRKDIIQRRPKLSQLILVLGAALYALVCQPAIRSRGFPEIDPLWLAAPWLWVVPVILSGLFEGATKERRQDVLIYIVLSTFFLSSTCIVDAMVPHHVNVFEIAVGMIFLAPLNLLIGFALEKGARAVFGLIRAFAPAQETVPPVFPLRVFVAGVLIVAATVSFPFINRMIDFKCARQRGVVEAEKDWVAGKAIWYVSREEEQTLFGASGNAYCVSNGLKTVCWYGGVTDAVYQKAYRDIIAAKLAHYGPAEKAKHLFTREELKALLVSGRMKKVENFPLKCGVAVISADGSYRSGKLGSSRGEPCKYVYAGAVDEKDKALVVATDDEILVFDPEGNILQHVEYWSDQELFCHPPGFTDSH